MFDVSSIKDYITIVASTGTFISAIVALLTVGEVKKQRRSAYKPDLFLDSFGFEVTNNPLLDGRFPKFKLIPYNQLRDDDKTNESTYINYSLINIGLGAAKSIKCKWEFDYKTAIKEISSILPSDCSIRNLYSKFANSEVYEIKRNGFYDYLHIDDLKERSLEFILPASVNTNMKILSVPHVIIQSFLYYLLFKHNLLDFEVPNFNIEDFQCMPSVKLTLTYNDINREFHEKNFDLTFIACTTSTEDKIKIEGGLLAFSVVVKEL